MAFPTIPTGGRILAQPQADTSSTRTFPSLSNLTKNAGDLLIAVCVIHDGNSTNAEFSGWGGGFTEFKDQATANTMGIGLAYKWSTGSETGTFTVTVTASQAGHAGLILMSIPGAHLTTPPEAGDIANNTTAGANPGVFNPAGWDVEDTLWIAVAGCGETATGGAFGGITNSPANYSGDVLTGISADQIGGMEAGVGFRQNAAASEDPGAWAVDTSNARNSALVIAVRPAPEQTIVNGGVAASSESVPAGTIRQPQAPVAGGTAGENDTALAGSVAMPQVISGGRALEADRAPPGLSGVISRSFDATDDSIVLGPGSLTDLGNGAMSMVVIARPLASEFGFMVSACTDTETIFGFGQGGTGMILSLANGDTRFGFLGVSMDEWQVFAVTLADGVQPAPRFHRKALGSGSWAHGDGSVLSLEWQNSTPITHIQVNGLLGAVSLKAHDQAVFAIWQDTALSDGQVEGMDDNLRTADLLVAGPRVLAELDQANVTDPVLDLIGDADETSRTGTTVNLDGPRAWTYLQLLSASGAAAESDSVPGGTVSYGPPQEIPATGVAAESDAALGGTITQPQAPVVGGVAQESDHANAGTLIQPQLVTGGVASEADSLAAGTITQPQAPVAGGVAASSESAPAGKVAQTYTAAAASEDDSAPAGSPQVGGPQTIPGQVAVEADSAPAGTVAQAQTISGGVASEADSAPSGQVAQVYPASGAASESDSAPAGSVLQSQPPVSGGTASEADSAPSGQVVQFYTAAPGSEADSVPAGAVLQLVFGGTAVEADSAPAGFSGAGQSVSGGVAASSESAPPGQTAQAILVVGGVASEADAALAGTILETLYGGTASETDTAPGGSAVSPTVVLGGVAGEFDLVLAGDVGAILASITGSEIEKWGISGSQNGETMDLSEAAATVTLSERKL